MNLPAKHGVPMVRIVVRNLDKGVISRLKRRATLLGRSVEAEARQILNNAAQDTNKAAVGLGSRIAVRFAGNSLTEELLELRGQRPTPPRF